MCTHVHVRVEKGCVYVHVHAWVKDFKYWLISMCVCLCVYTGAWLHDTLYVPVNKYTYYATNTPLLMHTHMHTHTHVHHTANFYTQVVHTHIPEVMNVCVYMCMGKGELVT